MTATATPAMTTAAMAAIRPIALVRTPVVLSNLSPPARPPTHRTGDASAPRRGCQRGTVAAKCQENATASFGALQRFPGNAALWAGVRGDANRLSPVLRGGAHPRRDRLALDAAGRA